MKHANPQASAAIPNKPDLQVAVIGAGNIARSVHLPFLARLGVSVSVVLDPGESALAAAKPLVPSTARLMRSAKVSEEINPALANAAIVCSPNASHAEQVSALLDAGIDVLCEKPLACTLDDARRLVKQASDGGRVLQAGYYRRFQPTAGVVKRLIASGELGAPLSCEMRAGSPLTDPTPAIMDRTLCGGGALMDFGVHAIDQALYWFGPITLKEYADDAEGGIEANSVIRLEASLSSGSVPIVIALSRTHAIGYTASIEFERAKVEYNFLSGYRLLVGPREKVTIDGKECPAGQPMDVSARRELFDYFGDQFLEFTARMSGGPEVVSSLADAVRVTAITQECYAAKRKLTLTGGW